jgi:hypothetical protein
MLSAMDHHHDHDEHQWSRETSLLLEKLEHLSHKIDHNMSVLSDWAAQQQADLTTIASSLTTVVTGIAALDTLITNFQNSPGTLNATDQAALDGIQASVKSLVTQSAAINVTPPQVAASAAAAKA